MKKSFFDQLSKESLKHLLSMRPHWTKELLPIAVWGEHMVFATYLEDISFLELPKNSIVYQALEENMQALYNKLFRKDESALPDFSSLNEDAKPTSEAVSPMQSPPPISIPPTVPETTKSLDLKSLQLGEDSFSQFAKYFDKSMHLVKTQRGMEKKEVKGNWNIQSNSLQIIDLSGNSIFKIVCKSKKPYHGYVINNPINDAFFKTFLEGRIPEHITILPILSNHQVNEMYLGVCSKQKGESLRIEELQQIVNPKNLAA